MPYHDETNLYDSRNRMILPDGRVVARQPLPESPPPPPAPTVPLRSCPTNHQGQEPFSAANMRPPAGTALPPRLAELIAERDALHARLIDAGNRKRELASRDHDNVAKREDREASARAIREGADGGRITTAADALAAARADAAEQEADLTAAIRQTVTEACEVCWDAADDPALPAAMAAARKKATAAVVKASAAMQEVVALEALQAWYRGPGSGYAPRTQVDLAALQPRLLVTTLDHAGTISVTELFDNLASIINEGEAS